MNDDHLLTLILHLLAGGLIGLLGAGVAGQFGWRAADRLPGESRWPECVYCLRPLTWFEVFPLFGWLIRWKFYAFPCPCGLRKGLWAQPVAELLGFALGAAAMAIYGWSWAAVPLCLGLGLLPPLALIDIHFGIIPDELNILLGLLGFIWVWSAEGDIWLSLITAAILLALGLFFALVYSRWRKREMLGIGDVKFFAAAGFWLEPHMIPWLLLGAGAIGAVFNITWERLGGGKEAPFAPALCMALAGCIFYQILFYTITS